MRRPVRFAVKPRNVAVLSWQKPDYGHRELEFLGIRLIEYSTDATLDLFRCYSSAHYLGFSVFESVKREDKRGAHTRTAQVRATNVVVDGKRAGSDLYYWLRARAHVPARTVKKQPVHKRPVCGLLVD